ncbi:TetR/AcrR family transcriptional regulator C-terminal ligand-binding domain-containing protein [Streptomyces sp. NPDC002309]
MTEGTAARRGRGRRPAAEVRASVLAAAGRILLTDGLRAVTFDRVASDAGSSKMTLYKWWPSPGALAAEAYFAQVNLALEFAHTDDLRADLLAQLGSFVRWLTDEGASKPVSELIGAAQMDPGVANAWTESYLLPRRELARVRLRAAQQEGELREDADLDVIIDQLWGACYHRLLVVRVPLATRSRNAWSTRHSTVRRHGRHDLHEVTLAGRSSSSTGCRRPGRLKAVMYVG